MEEFFNRDDDFAEHALDDDVERDGDEHED